MRVKLKRKPQTSMYEPKAAEGRSVEVVSDAFGSGRMEKGYPEHQAYRLGELKVSVLFWARKVRYTSHTSDGGEREKGWKPWCDQRSGTLFFVR